MNLTNTLFRVLREAIERGPWTRAPRFFEDVPKGPSFSTVFCGVTGYVEVEGRVYKVTITPEEF